MFDIPMRFRESYFNEQVESVDEADSTIVEEEIFEECDWFVQLGDSLFYVSEYHNALFDDPDAHDDAINEFGILLDSYGEELVQEVASVGPYDEYLKKHKYDPKNNTIEDPNRPGKRVSAGKIGSEKERRRMNKFLRENGYDPKTETIQTDIPDPKPGQPSRKKRVKFTIDAHNGALMRRSDLSINMPPKSIVKKPMQSNQTFKHEEGHVNQFGNPGQTNADKQRMNAAKDYVRTLDRSKIQSDHDLAPTEYDADAYGAEHNRYNKRGTSAYSTLRSLVGDHVRDISKFEKSVNKSIRKKGIDKNSFEAQQQKLADILIKHPNHPGPNAPEIEWAEYLKKVYPTPEIFDAYIAYHDKKLDLTHWKRAERAKIKEGYKTHAVDSDEMIELEENYTRERKKRELEIERLGSKCLKAFDIIDDMIDLSELSPDNLKRHVHDLISKRLNAEISGTIRNAGYRDPAEMQYAHDQRAQFATQQFHAVQAKQRQLSKEQLKQQIDSGKLSKDQLIKAKRKLQRIEQFEKSQRK